MGAAVAAGNLIMSKMLGRGGAVARVLQRAYPGPYWAALRKPPAKICSLAWTMAKSDRAGPLRTLVSLMVLPIVHRIQGGPAIRF